MKLLYMNLVISSIQLYKYMGVCDDMKNRQRGRRKDEGGLARSSSRVDCRQAKRSNRRSCNCCCDRVGRVRGKAKACSETREVGLSRRFESPAEAVVTVASLCLSLPIAVVLAQGNAAKLYHLQ